MRARLSLALPASLDPRPLGGSSPTSLNQTPRSIEISGSQFHLEPAQDLSSPSAIPARANLEPRLDRRQNLTESATRGLQPVDPEKRLCLDQVLRHHSRFARHVAILLACRAEQTIGE